MECQFVRFRYGPAVQTVGLYPGLPSDELSKILKTVLPVVGNIVGLQAENGTVIPLSLACRSPGVLSGSIFVILTSPNSTDEVEQSRPPEQSIPSAPPMTSAVATEMIRPSSGSDPRLAAPAPPLKTSADPVYDDELSAEDAQLADSTLDELLRFIAGLRVKRIVKKAEADALEEMLFNNSSLVFAAYSVAKSAGDSQYLAEVCKDIAQSMMTSAGQSACEAQDDVLQCCDQLYINGKVTENQLLYLRHLVLIRDEDVAQLYDDFQEHLSRDRLFRDLFHLANTHPRLSQDEMDDDDAADDYEYGDEEEDEEEEEDDASDQWAALQREQQRRRQQEADLISADEPPPRLNPYSRQASQERAAARKQAEESKSGRSSSARTNTLNGLLSMMLRTGDVTPVEAMILNHMITSDNEIINAAYDIYQSDGDLTELQDTMMRCAKLEMRRRNEEISKQQRDIDAAGERDDRRRALLQKYGDEADEDDNDDGDSEDEEDQEEEEDEDQLATGGDEVLANLLESMGVSNAWEDTVPARFILSVFAAAQRRLLSVGQAKALCDLYQAQYDLVRAAWEVFNVQGDVVDFTDTLRRIVRDLNFRDDGNVRMSALAKEKPSPSRSKTKQDAEVMEAVRQGQASSEAAKNGREEALAAVAAAKRELLKHSLEIMVKQGLVTTAAATGLYERALRGDPLTDAAIDSYAADRDIMEFLDTLQILANNSPEDLDNIMRQAMADEENEEEEDQEEEDQEDDEYDPRRASTSDRDNSSPSVPEEEEVDESEDLDLAQKQLRALVLKLLRDKVISTEYQSILLKLIISRDDRIMAAHDVYRDFGDEDDLVDSLLRIARKERSGLTRKASDDGGIEMSDISYGSKKKGRRGEEGGVEVEMTRFRRGQEEDEDEEDKDDIEMADLDDEEQEEESPSGLLNSGDQKSILEILAKARAIDVDTGLRLIELIEAEDVGVRRVFLIYEQNKDVYRLIENLKQCVMENSPDDDEEDDNEEDDNEEDDNEDEEEEDEDEEDTEGQGLDDDEREAIETRFLNIIQNMNLSHLETAALRLAIARDDPSIRAALENFRSSRNTEALKRALRDVAKNTIAETLSEAGYDGVEGEEEEGQEDDNQDDDDNNEEDDNKDDDDADEDEDADDSEARLMSTQSARDYIFPILIGELVKENVMSSSEGDLLRGLFEKGDDVVNAALDVYDLDSDMAELVDTLQRVVQTHNGER